MTTAEGLEQGPAAAQNAPHGSARPAFRLGDWLIEPELLRVSRGNDSSKLEPKVMALLTTLAQRPGEVVSRQQLEDTVWAGTVVSYDALTGAIQKLRRALDDDPRRPRIIETLSKRGYRLVAPVVPVDRDTPAAVSKNDKAGKQRGTRVLAWVVAGLAALLLVLGLVFTMSTETRVAGKSTATTAAQDSIAVLPFVSLGQDDTQAYLADGITDDLITGLAKHPALLVISRDSSFLYKDTPLESREVAERLNVRYILQGSMRREHGQVRINAQLVDTRSDGVSWADQYDGSMQDMFSLQDDILRDIVSALGLEASGATRAAVMASEAPEAYESFLIGRQHFYLFASHDVNNRARELFEAAIRYDPNYAQAYAMLAWTHVYDVMNGWSDDRDTSLQQAIALASQALSLREDLPVAYFVRGLAHRERGEYVPGLLDAEQAIEFDPNYAHAHMLLATLLYYAGRPEEGLQRVRQAMLINPHHPYNYTFHLGQAYYILGRYEEAVNAFEQGAASNPASERIHVWLAAAYAQAGDIEAAEWEVAQVHVLHPGFSREHIGYLFPFSDNDDRERFVEGLRKAGL